MAFFDRDKNAAADRANFSAAAQCAFNGRAVSNKIDNVRRDGAGSSETSWHTAYRRTPEESSKMCGIEKGLADRRPRFGSAQRKKKKGGTKPP